MRRKRFKGRDINGNATQCVRERKFHRRHRLKAIQQSGKCHVERSKRSRQALGWDHEAMVDYSSPLWQPFHVVAANAGTHNRKRLL
jgi:hypothetical protein